MERRPAGALRVVLVRDRRPEEGHDPVARVLVHRSLEAVHAVGEDGEEAVEDPVPRLGVHLLGELHRALHVGEEDGHLLALALEGGARGEDLLGEMTGGVGARRLPLGWRPDRPRRCAAVVAEPCARGDVGVALRAAGAQGIPALETQSRVEWILVAAGWALHGRAPHRPRTRLACQGVSARGYARPLALERSL